MVNKLPDPVQRTEAKKEIIRYGGAHLMNRNANEYFDEWLLFLTNPLNLQSNLPDLTIIFDGQIFGDSYIRISFSKTKASIRSLKFELQEILFESTDLFLDEPDPKKIISLIDGKPTDPCRIKKWMFNLFLHSELEELELPSTIRKQAGILDKLPKAKIRWVEFSQ